MANAFSLLRQEPLMALRGCTQAASRRFFWAIFAPCFLTGASLPASQGTKLSPKSLAVRCKAVFTEQIFVKTRRPNEGILAYGERGRHSIGGNMPVKTGLRPATQRLVPLYAYRGSFLVCACFSMPDRLPKNSIILLPSYQAVKRFPATVYGIFPKARGRRN